MKKSLLFVFILGITSIGFSQTAENPWRVAISANAIDLYPVGATEGDFFSEYQGDLFEDFTNISDHWSISGPTISVDRFIGKGFSLGAMITVNNVNKIHNTTGQEYPYLSVDAYGKFSPLGGKSISPFILGGFGMSSFQLSNPNDQNPLLLSRNASKQFFGGFGMDFKITPNVSLSLQTNYKYPYELYGIKHFQHQVGLSYNFGSGDSDKDGISDKKDKCPEVAGLKEFEGCPDTDEDGIPDNEDGCPEEAGTKELNGCPDIDGDGVVDKDDLCPEIPGSVEMAGCVDTDGDGVHDGIDECPDKKGTEETNGCPNENDTDGDGILDADDLCPDQAGLAENNGCPEVSDAVVSTMNGYGAMINFMANSDRILGRKMFDVLKKIKVLLDENPTSSFVIEGYSSSDGDSAINQSLSIKRAESVRNALIQMGIDSSRLEVAGFGAEKPLESNDTAQGRALNRRVQFRLKK